jgi:hypothetical protein
MHRQPYRPYLTGMGSWGLKIPETPPRFPAELKQGIQEFYVSTAASNPTYHPGGSSSPKEPTYRSFHSLIHMPLPVPYGTRYRATVPSQTSYALYSHVFFIRQYVSPTGHNAATPCAKKAKAKASIALDSPLDGALPMYVHTVHVMRGCPRWHVPAPSHTSFLPSVLPVTAGSKVVSLPSLLLDAPGFSHGDVLSNRR